MNGGRNGEAGAGNGTAAGAGGNGAGGNAGSGEVTGWALVYGDHDPTRTGLREALCTLGNGLFATRGAAEEAAADGTHYPGTYLAGGYDRAISTVAGLDVETEDLVNMPNWLPLVVRPADGVWLSPDTAEVLAWRLTLDLYKGLLVREVTLRDDRGRITRLTSRRLVSMARPHIAAIETTVVAENWSGTLQIRSGLDGQVVNAGVARYAAFDGHHLRPVDAGAEPEADLVFLKVETHQSELRVALAARTRVLDAGGQRREVERRPIIEPGRVEDLLAVEVTEGVPVRIEKVVGLHTGRDFALSEAGVAARETAAAAPGFEGIVNEHVLAWEHLWRRFDLEIELEEDDGGRIAGILRLHIFHLLQVASPHVRELDVGVPARGLHGEAYRGHIFWDELFIFPLLNLRLPKITRSLLLYRYRRLDAARAAARAAGHAGAMFPWQSGSSGREEGQVVHLNPRSGRWVPDNTRLQRHVGIAIAWNVWQYYQATGDLEFLFFYGAELILEIARFWASVAAFDIGLGRYEIRGVMGPDEYHDAYPGALSPGIDNNAYTNVMAVWVLCRALDVLDMLPADRRNELTQRLGLTTLDVEYWRMVSRRMYLVFHDNGIVSQFENYRALEELPLADLEQQAAARGRSPRDVQRLDRFLETDGDTPNRYKVSKQADVLMLFYLLSAEQLGELFDRLEYELRPDTIPRTVDYYVARTSHGSTLSRVVHAWVLARSDRRRSWHFFCEALVADVADAQGGTTPEGIHLGAMAGTVDMLQRCYTGLETRGDVLWLNPLLPDALKRLRLHLRYRGQSLELDLTRREMSVRVLGGLAAHSIKVGFGTEIHLLAPGESRVFTLPRDDHRRHRGPGREVRP